MAIHPFSLGRKGSAVLFLAALLLASPATARAHAVYIFAWPEDGKICTESYFSKKSKVRGGEVRMEDSSGRILRSALTDDAGIVCFSPPPLPQGSGDLRFVVLAGEGHRGEFLLPAPLAEESAITIASPSAPEAEPRPTPPAAHNGYSPSPQEGGDGTAARSADAALLTAMRSLLREELRRELAPVHKALAAGAEEGPSLRDIIGGLGWIMGLTGLAALCASRKKRS